MLKRSKKSKVIFSIICITTLLTTLLPLNNGALAADPVNHTVTVNPNAIINNDFIGVGVDIIPTVLMENNLANGYNEAYWQMDQKRLIMMKPKLARVWFQTDWFEQTKGVYTWNSDKMLAFYKYMDALKAAGTEVEFNFGWKVGRSIQSWFSMGGAGRISAPADLNAFAAACSACLNHLINVKGYTNIKYLTFYNEPHGGYDFEGPSDQKAYYAQMVRTVSDKLIADGRRSLVKIWGPEDSGAYDWFQYMKDNADSSFDGYSFHVYGMGYDNLISEISARKAYVAPKPVYLTEFGWACEGDANFGAGYANSVIGGANSGLSGMAVWQFNGVYCEDPDETTNTDGDWALTDSLVTTLYAKNQFYQVSMLARYIPAHSTVVSTTTDNAGRVRAAAFKTSSGDYTVVVECRDDGLAKNLTVDFSGVNIGKTFQKHVYTDFVPKEKNTLIPAVSGSFPAGTSFTDTDISGDYSVIVYTTLPSQTQVATTGYKNIDKGQSVQLTADVIDNTGGVTWSVVSGGGTVSSSGLFTPPADAQYEDMMAIKATSVADPTAYGITLIKISTADEEPVPPPVIRPEPAETGAVLFSDDFSGGMSKWANSSNCSIVNGQLKVESNETIQNAVGGETWQNYSIEADVTVEVGAAGFVFRKQDDNNMYMWQFNTNTKCLVPHKKLNGGWGPIKNVSCDISVGVPFHVRIDVSGDVFTTFVDGILIDRYKDKAYFQSNFDYGKVGFRQSGERALIDNFVVKEILNGFPVPVATSTPTPSPTPAGSTPTPTPTSTPTPIPGAPAGYIWCSGENSTFTLPDGVYDIAYGANGNYLYQYGKTGTVTFSNAAFGGDPCPNVLKSGYYKQAGSTPMPTTTPTPIPTATPTPISDTPTPTPASMLSDDFSSTLDNWTNTTNCSISEGVLAVSGNETIQSVSGGSNWQDYTIEVDTRIIDSAAGIVFRKADGNNMYMWQLSNTYGSLRPHKKVNGSWSTIKSVPFTFSLNTWYHLKIEIAGSTIKTYIDGTLIDTTTDTQFTSGKVGFRAISESAQFDNLIVK